jgi:integrase
VAILVLTALKSGAVPSYGGMALRLRLMFTASTEREVEKLIEVAKRNRRGQRDATILLLCFRHGLRASELIGLQWSDVNMKSDS